MKKETLNFRKLDRFMERMELLGIDIKLTGNVPWIYISRINDKPVTELFHGNHGFTIGFYPRSKDEEFEFTDIGEIFKLIRKYR
jgi:hypothetical protein